MSQVSLTSLVSPHLTQLATDSKAGDKIAREILRLYNWYTIVPEDQFSSDCQHYLTRWKKHKGIE